jgi:two-component system, OmpR family, phosphate regulon sensor histidine kinase PhoR
VAGERILVVDDSMEMRDFLANSVLLPQGYTVDRARNGREGIESAVANHPDLIITDNSMPEVTGVEMLEDLRQRGLSMPAILMTAEGSEDIAVRALRAGVMDYFVKPFDPMELDDAVKRILGATRIGGVRTSVPDQRRMQVLNTLMAVGKSITSLLDLESILTRVVEAAVYLSGAEEGTLMLLDPASGDLYMRASKNVDEGLKHMTLRVQDSLAGQALSTGEPVLISGSGPQKIKTALLVQSLMYVPLRLGNRAIGVLGVHNRKSDATIAPEAAGSLTVLADYAAIAIVNAQFYYDADSERSKLNRLLNQTQDGVLLIDPADRIALCNPVARQFLTRPEVIGSPIREVTENASLLELLQAARQRPAGETGLLQGEIQLDTKTFNAHVSRIDGIGMMVMMQDITELKELDRIKSELVTMVSHDLRSPLTAILSYIELLGRVGELNEEQTEFMRQAKQSVYAITSLINDLLDVNKIESGMDRHREPVDVGQIAQQVSDAAIKQAALKKQEFKIAAAGDLPKVLGNPTRLRQVFANLVDNAIKYTPEGGEINMNLFAEQGQIVLMVSDTGIGIPPEDQPHIFDKFYRVKGVTTTHVGTGLGLNIVKSAVESHDGRIWVQSVPGQGTTFTVVFPPHVE